MNSSTDPATLLIVAANAAQYEPALQQVVSDANSFCSGALTLSRDHRRDGITDSLIGVIPITYRNRTFNIPIEIVLLRAVYPREQPFCRLCPTPSMAVASLSFVDVNTGDVIWGMYNWQGSFLSYLQELQKLFSSQPPLRARRPDEVVVQQAQPSKPNVAPPMTQPAVIVKEPSNKEEKKDDDEGICCICYDKKAKFAMVPCGHVALCKHCKEILLQRSDHTCPCCRKTFTQVIEIFTT